MSETSVGMTLKIEIDGVRVKDLTKSLAVVCEDYTNAEVALAMAFYLDRSAIAQLMERQEDECPSN